MDYIELSNCFTNGLNKKNSLFHCKELNCIKILTCLRLTTTDNDVSYKILPHGGAFVYQVSKSITVVHIVASG